MPDIRETGVLDDFNRADEDPLSFDGKWQTLTFAHAQVLRLNSNKVDVDQITAGTSQDSHWISWFAGDVEVWAKTVGGHDITEGLRLWLCVDGTYWQSGATTPLAGYSCEWVQAIIGGNLWTIYRWTNGVRTELVQVSSSLDTGSGMMLFRKIGDTLTGFKCDDYVGNTWIEVLSVDDSTYNSGFIGLGTHQDDSNPGWTEFGGGARRRTQIYRYVSN